MYLGTYVYALVHTYIVLSDGHTIYLLIMYECDIIAYVDWMWHSCLYYMYGTYTEICDIVSLVQCVWYSYL